MISKEAWAARDKCLQTNQTVDLDAAIVELTKCAGVSIDEAGDFLAPLDREIYGELRLMRWASTPGALVD